MNKWLKVILLCSLIFLLSVGCSNNENTSNTTNENEPTEASNKDEITELTISAAASLEDAMNTIQESFEKENPNIKLNFNFGASGALQQQISQGAPVDLFFSAAEDKFDLLIDEGQIEESNGIDLLKNELVLIVNKDSEVDIANFEDLLKEDVTTISIGTPDSVPAGQYAKESLENIQLWEDVESKIIPAKDVRQVLSYVETNNVQAGIVYKTDTLISDKVKIVATAADNSHTPIIYPVGIIKDTEHKEQATVFYEFLQSDAVLKVFEEYGFSVK